MSALDVVGAFCVWAKVRNGNFNTDLTKRQQNARDIDIYSPVNVTQKNRRSGRQSPRLPKQHVSYRLRRQCDFLLHL